MTEEVSTSRAIADAREDVIAINELTGAIMSNVSTLTDFMNFKKLLCRPETFSFNFFCRLLNNLTVSHTITAKGGGLPKAGLI